RAFAYDGHAFVWLAFAAESGGTTGLKAQLQNTYFLYRDDGLLVAKAAANRAGGFAATSGHLPGVQALGDDRFAWCGTMRRIVPLGDQKGYSARAPLAIEVQFDAD